MLNHSASPSCYSTAAMRAISMRSRADASRWGSVWPRATVALLAAMLAMGGARADQASGLVLLKEPQYNAIPGIPPTVAPFGLPPSVDLSKDFPAPRQQGSQQSCAGWAVGYAAKSYLERQERKWKYSDATLFSPAFIYNQLNTDPGCQGSVTLPAAMNVLSTEDPPLSVFPYKGRTAWKPAAPNYRLPAVLISVPSFNFSQR